MCYIMTSFKQVGVRELRQNLSVYLREVKRGRSLEVIERGRTVALLTPLRAEATVLERLVTAGRVRAAAGDLLELGAPPVARLDTPLGAALEALRAE